MGGTPKRVEQFAYTIMAEIGHKLPCGTTLQDISQFSYRYSMYKVGPVLSISVSIRYTLFSRVMTNTGMPGMRCALKPGFGGHQEMDVVMLEAQT